MMVGYKTILIDGYVQSVITITKCRTRPYLMLRLQEIKICMKSLEFHVSGTLFNVDFHGTFEGVLSTQFSPLLNGP